MADIGNAANECKRRSTAATFPDQSMVGCPTPSWNVTPSALADRTHGSIASGGTSRRVRDPIIIALDLAGFRR